MNKITSLVAGISAMMGGFVVAVILSAGAASKPPGFCNTHPNHPSCQVTTTTSTTTTTTTAPPSGLTPPTSIARDCSVDVTSSLRSWLNAVPSNSTIVFPSTACYRIDGTMEFDQKTGLVLEGNGTTFRSIKPMVSGNYDDGQRAMWRFLRSSGIVFRNMTIDGAYTKGGVHDESIQHAHGIDLRGTNANVSNVTFTDLAGDGVYFGLDYYSNTLRSSGSVKDSTVQRIGRNAVSVTAANDVLVQRVATSAVGFIAFDVEPNETSFGAGYGTDRITFQDNTIGSYYLYAYAIVQTALNRDQKFLTNQGTSTKGLRIGIIDPANTGIRAQRLTITGNTTTVTTQSPAIEARNVDTLTVTNNAIPTTIMLACNSVTGLTFSGNTPNTSSGC